MINNIPALFSLYYYDDIKLYPPFSSGISLTNFLTQLLFLKSMKRSLLYLIIVVAGVFMLSSCTATKRDCQGNKHVRLKNGIYL